MQIKSQQTISIDELDGAIKARRRLAESLFDRLRSLTADGEGVTRASYGTGEQIAHDLARDVAIQLGLQVETDAAGNLLITLEGRSVRGQKWMTGSHLDSVHNGGNFDGAAGVVAGLVVLAAMRDLNVCPENPLSVIAIRAEECSTWFVGRHGGHLGSRAALGLLETSELDSAIHVSTGKTLAEMIDLAGFDSARFRRPVPVLGRANIAGFVELHIEQGPILEHYEIPVGIVTGIRGCTRARNGRTLGEYSHSGAVPHELRRDAVMGTADFIMALDDEWRAQRERGEDLVVTCGIFSTDHERHSIVKIPGEVRFALDFRSKDTHVLESFEKFVRDRAEVISRSRDVEIQLGSLDYARPALMDPSLREDLVSTAKGLGVNAIEIASGGGHDAADFAEVGIPSAMIFVRNANGSHNPEEAMRIDDFMEATRLLGGFLGKKVGLIVNRD